MKNKADTQEELISYFDEVLKVLKTIRGMAGSRNKTLRIRAIDSMAQITEARVTASKMYARSGGYEEFILLAQKGLYGPIIEYLAEEVAK